jgi:hypothetical protein
VQAKAKQEMERLLQEQTKTAEEREALRQKLEREAADREALLEQKSALAQKLKVCVCGWWLVLVVVMMMPCLGCPRCCPCCRGCFCCCFKKIHGNGGAPSL